jgi:hypothetical protein
MLEMMGNIPKTRTTNIPASSPTVMQARKREESQLLEIYFRHNAALLGKIPGEAIPQRAGREHCAIGRFTAEWLVVFSRLALLRFPFIQDHSFFLYDA